MSGFLLILAYKYLFYKTLHSHFRTHITFYDYINRGIAKIKLLNMQGLKSALSGVEDTVEFMFPANQQLLKTAVSFLFHLHG